MASRTARRTANATTAGVGDDRRAAHTRDLGRDADADKQRKPAFAITEGADARAGRNQRRGMSSSFPHGPHGQRVGGGPRRSFVVDHQRSAAEPAFTDTDARMRDSVGISGAA